MEKNAAPAFAGEDARRPRAAFLDECASHEGPNNQGVNAPDREHVETTQQVMDHDDGGYDVRGGVIVGTFQDRHPYIEMPVIDTHDQFVGSLSVNAENAHAIADGVSGGGFAADVAEATHRFEADKSDH